MRRISIITTCMLIPTIEFAQSGTSFLEKKGGADNPGDRSTTNAGAGAPCGTGAPVAGDKGLGENSKNSATNNAGGNVKGKDC